MASLLTRSLSTKVAKRLEKPKPLKGIIPNRHSFSDKEFLQQSEQSLDVKTPDTPLGNADDVLGLLDLVSSSIQTKDYNNILPLTSSLTSRLKHSSIGVQLEEYHEGKLNNLFEIFRTGAHDCSLDRQSRLNLLQIVELRAAQWHITPGFTSYYNSRSGLPCSELNEIYGDSLFDFTQQILGPGDVLKSSGKYSSPTRVTGKNYCKDEVVIRNSDSGKVMGIKGRRVHMIEELSETVISFQRVNPGAKERLVQITGPTEDKIVYAKNLIEDTIKRNASPVRDLGVVIGSREVAGSNSSINSSASDESNRLLNTIGRNPFNTAPKEKEPTTEFKYSVHVQNDVIHISSTNLSLLNDAFSLLDSLYFGSDEGVNLSVHSSSNARQEQNSSNISGVVHSPDSRQGALGSEPNHVENEKQLEDCKTPAQNTNGYLRQYSRQFLLDCSSTKASFMLPPGWSAICDAFPAIVRQSPMSFDATTYQKKWLETDDKAIACIPTAAEDCVDSD